MLALVPAEPSEHVGVVASAIIVLSFAGCLLGFLIVALGRVVEAVRLARRAKAATREEATLARGRAVVSGPVELAHDEKVAARVEVDQEGTETENSGSWQTRWTERDRRVTMRPFYVRHGQGRVRVEPEDRAFLVDAMDGMILVNTTHRTRFAELSPGERVFAVGCLEQGHDPENRADYRSGGRGWVLRAPPGEELLLSSEPLHDRYVRRVAAQGLLALIALLLLTIFGASVSTYVARVARGVTVVGTVEDRATSTDSDDNVSYHLTVALDRGATLQLDATQATYEAGIVGAQVTVRDVPSWSDATVLGTGPTVNGGIAAIGVLLVALVLLARYLIRRAFSKWYEAKVVDTLSGRLDPNQRATSM
jgi:hypothetical protein